MIAADDDTAAPAMRHALSEAVTAIARGDIAILLRRAPDGLGVARFHSRTLCELLLRHAGSGAYCSRSATPGLSGVAACRSRPVGIDVQAVTADWVDSALVRLALHPEEQALMAGQPRDRFFHLWTRKEAALKALGTGLAIAPGQVVTNLLSGWQQIALCGRTIHVRQLDHPASHCVAVAALEGAPRIQQWTVT